MTGDQFFYFEGGVFFGMMIVLWLWHWDNCRREKREEQRKK